MGLLALPNDILLLVCGLLPLLPAIRLGNSGRLLYRLVRDPILHTSTSLSPTSIYFALLRKEVDTFTKLCKEFKRKLPDDDAIYYFSDSRFTAENQHLETLKDCLCASVYVLVVARAETGQEWWAPLTGLASGLAAASDSLFRRSYVTGRHHKAQSVSIQVPSQRIIQDALQKKRYTALQHLYQPAREDVFKAIRTSDLRRFFAQFCRTPFTKAWTTSDRTQAVTLLAHISCVRRLGLGLAEMSHGRSYASDTYDSDSDIEDDSDGELSTLDALVSTDDFALIVSVIVQQSSPPHHPAFRMHTRRILDSCLANGTRDLFHRVMKSYLVAIAYYAPQRSHTLEYLIECPTTIPNQFDKVCALYAMHGITNVDCVTFLKLLAETPFTTHVVPWLLGQCPSSPHAHLRIEWLLNYTHLHQATLHYLPFNPSNLRYPQCVQRILDRVPIDVAGMHLDQNLKPSTMTRQLPDWFCFRCQSIADATLAHYFDPHLARFASRIWVVSVDPIPESQLRDEARAVAALVAGVPVNVNNANSWADYYALVRGYMKPPHQVRQVAKAIGGANSITSILWASSPASFKVNIVDHESLALGLLEFREFNAIVDVVQQAATPFMLAFLGLMSWAGFTTSCLDTLRNWRIK